MSEQTPKDNPGQSYGALQMHLVGEVDNELFQDTMGTIEGLIENPPEGATLGTGWHSRTLTLLSAPGSLLTVSHYLPQGRDKNTADLLGEYDRHHVDLGIAKVIGSIAFIEEHGPETRRVSFSGHIDLLTGDRILGLVASRANRLIDFYDSREGEACFSFAASLGLGDHWTRTVFNAFALKGQQYRYPEIVAAFDDSMTMRLSETLMDYEEES